MSVWTCDGVPKDGKQYPGAFPHNPQENTGPDCTLCGLPKEAMQPPGKTRVIGDPEVGGSSKSWLIPAVVAMLVLLIGGGLGVYLLLNSNSPNNNGSIDPPEPPPVSPIPASKGESVSRGEKLFLAPSPNKQAGAQAFAQENWQEAIAAYQTASQQNRNDPEEFHVIY